MSLDNGQNEESNTPEPSVSAAFFDIDQDEASRYLDYLAKFPRSKQICLCGHTVPSHQFSTAIGYTCKPNNHYCPCDRVNPVFFAGDARHFKRSTHGPGMKHALSLGIAAMRKSGAVGQWLVELKCAFPGCENPEIVPTPVERLNGTGCPVCRGLLVIPGVNDLQTLRPDGLSGILRKMKVDP